MNKATKKLILQIHLWIGLITGIVLFVEGITGAVYVFSIEISDLIYKDRYTTPTLPDEQAQMSISELTTVAKNAIGEDIPIFMIYHPNKPQATIAFIFQELDHEPLFYHNYVKFFKTVYLNPYTAELIKIENTKWEFFNVIMYLHISLLMSYEVGSQIVAWSVVGFIAMLISGLVLWWPKNKKSRGMRFWFKWKQGFGLKRKNFDLHAVLGFYTIAFALIISITGLFWSFQALNSGIQWLANGGKTIERPLPKPPESPNLTHKDPLDNVYHFITSKSPEAESFVIKMPRRPEYPFVCRAYNSKDLIYDRTVYYFDSETGHHLRTDEVSDLSTGEKVSGVNYDIHVGSIGGLPTKILAFITCLIIASLPITGFIIWRNKSYDI